MLKKTKLEYRHFRTGFLFDIDSLQVKLRNNIYPDFTFFLKGFRSCLVSWIRTEPEKAESLLNTLQTEVQKVIRFCKKRVL